MRKDTNQTAVDFLFKMYHENNGKLYVEHFNHASQLEKEQIEIAFDLGRDEVTSAFIIDGEDYFNKKFKK
jgi:hypothetical protein